MKREVQDERGPGLDFMLFYVLRQQYFQKAPPWFFYLHTFSLRMEPVMVEDLIQVDPLGRIVFQACTNQFSALCEESGERDD
ncbi:MAG: hypothetical protein ACRC2N_13985 [Aeromonas sp.]